MSTPSFKAAVTLGVVASAGFAMPQPASWRAGVFVAGLGFTSWIAWSSVAKFRTLVYRTTDPWAPRVPDKSGRGWSDAVATGRLQQRYQEVTAKGFGMAAIKLTFGVVAGAVVGYPEVGFALAIVGAGSDLITSFWSIHADVVLTRGKWCVLQRRLRLSSSTPVLAPRQ